MRKPKEYQAREPGDIVQVDTLDVRPLPGVVLKHFTARDVVSRWDVLEVHTRATATTAKAFLDTLQEPFSRWDVLEVHTRATATTAKAFLDTLQDRLPFPLKFPMGPPKDGRGQPLKKPEGAPVSRPAKSGVLEQKPASETRSTQAQMAMWNGPDRIPSSLTSSTAWCTRMPG